MLDLNLRVTTRGGWTTFSLAEMWDYYHQNSDALEDADISLGDYISSQVMNWAAYSANEGEREDITFSRFDIDSVDLSEYVQVEDPTFNRDVFQEIQSLLWWIDGYNDVDRFPADKMRVLAFLAYVGENGWEFINFDEIEGFMNDAYRGTFNSLWDHVKDLMASGIVDEIPDWAAGAVDEDIAVDSLTDDGVFEYVYGRDEYHIFSH